MRAVLYVTPQGGTMKILHSQFTAKPGHEDEVAEMICGFADKVRTEPGNRVFDVYRHSDDPAKFFVMEAYVDEDAFHTHLGMPYGGPFNDRLEEIIEEPHSVLTFIDQIA
jgi:hypothetical protein